MRTEDLFEMSNISREDSGLPVRVWVSSKMSAAERHGPRIKIEIPGKGSPTIPVLLKKDITVDDVVGYEYVPAKILNPLRDFINLNYDVLIQYWNDEISTKQMILSIKGIR
jgi:hypothetical protein